MENPIWEELTSKEKPVQWLLPDLLPRGSLIALAGLPGAGKSSFSYTMAMGMATGTAVLNRTPPHPFRVVYFDDENAIHDRREYQRWAAWGLGLTAKQRPLLETNFWCYAFALGGDDWDNVVAKAIDDHDPDVMIFDTATPCFHIEDENDNAEASRVIRGLRGLMMQRTPHIAAWVLKHGRIREDATDDREAVYTLRGAKAWEGAVDGIIYHTRRRGRPRADGLTITKLVPGKTRAFGLRAQTIINPDWVHTSMGKGLKLSASHASEE